MQGMLIRLAALGALCACGQIQAQDRSDPSLVVANDTPSATPTQETPVAAPAPAGTVVEIEILDPLTSWERHRGDRFRLQLASPLVINGIELIPAGTPGTGEIVHAAGARGGGAPGELLIAARTLDIDGVSVPLRGFKLGATGGDNSGMALGVSFAAGPFAMFIRGFEIEIPAGTRGTAKLAQPLTRIATPPTLTEPLQSTPTHASPTE